MSSTLDSLQHLMETRSLRQIDVAQGTGLSSSTISQYLAGKYAGNIAEVEEKIASYVELERERDPFAKKQTPFQMTTVAKKVFEVARECHRDGSIGIVVGDSGLGKTRSVKEYAAKNRGVIVLEAHPLYLVNDILAELHKALKLSGMGTPHQMVKEIKDRLIGSGRMIIVDEAEHLRPNALDLLRRIHDFAGIGVLYVGLPKFRSQLAALRKGFEYITNRVRIPAELKRLTPKDVELIVTQSIPNANGLCKVYHQASGGVARTLENIVANTVRVSEFNDTPIDPDMIRQVGEQLTV